MFRRRKLILAFVAMMAILILVSVITSKPEPCYRGITLSRWLSVQRSYELRGLSVHFTFILFNEEPEWEKLGPEATRAIGQIGTNALPSLIAWMDLPKSTWKSKLKTTMEKLPARLRPKALPAWLDYYGDMDRSSLAYTGFGMLGQTAAPAIPELERIARERRALNPDSAIHVLVQLGKPAIPALTNLLAPDVPKETQRIVLSGLGHLGSSAAESVPAIIAVMNQSDQELACLAARTLGQITRRAEIAVPALVGHMDDSRYAVRLAAVQALGEYGSEALPAVPRLRELLVQPDLELGRQAEQALTMIVSGPSSEPIREGFNLLLPLLGTP